MVETKVLNSKGEPAGTINLSPAVFEVFRKNTDVVHQAVVSHLASGRQVSAHAKTRGQVRGGGKKPWKQKGTGRARAGSSRSPLWRGGGITFGPSANRNFTKKINRRAARLAMMLVLSDKARDSKFHIFENFEIAAGKTKELANHLKDLRSRLSLGKKLLIVLSAKDEKLLLAARNLQSVRVKLANNLNIFDLLSADDIILVKDALPILEKIYSRNL